MEVKMHIPYRLISYCILFVSNSLLTVINVVDYHPALLTAGYILQILFLLLILIEFASLLKQNK